jgi:uncharacterized protein YodC (DUF2158 family)
MAMAAQGTMATNDPEKLKFEAYPVGSVVYLKSGSPPLTAMGAPRQFSRDGIEKHEIVDVEWFAGAEVRRDSFLAECITNDPAANTMAMQKADPPKLTTPIG